MTYPYLTTGNSDFLSGDTATGLFSLSKNDYVTDMMERLDYHERAPNVAHITTYPPRGCGIGTFARDLARALLIGGHVSRNHIVAIENRGVSEQYQYGTGVWFTMNQFNLKSYHTAASILNNSDVDVVSLQHEYGIFGGEWGEYAVDLCRSLNIPIVTTFHTVLPDPSDKARIVLSDIANMSHTVVVTIESARRLLEELYGVDGRKIRVIPHGAALPERGRVENAKKQLGLGNRTVLATYGLLNPGKGLEYAINALHSLLGKHKNLMLLIVGQTHPEVQRREREKYREKLTSLVEQLGLTDNVRFVNRYLRDDELSLYIQSTDIYLAPYLGQGQVSSGTITLALAHGKPVVSTPTIFAKEILSQDRGLFCRFADAKSIAECIDQILRNNRLRRRLERNALAFGKSVEWTTVAERYGRIFESITQGCSTSHSKSSSIGAVARQQAVSAAP